MKHAVRSATGSASRRPSGQRQADNTTFPDSPSGCGSDNRAPDVDEVLALIRKSWSDRRIKKEVIHLRERTLAALEEGALAAETRIVSEGLVVDTVNRVKSDHSETTWQLYLQPLKEVCAYCDISCDELASKPMGTKARTSVPERFAPVHEAYLARLELRDLAKQTMRRKERLARDFLHFLDDRVESIEDLAADDVEAFLAAKAKVYSKGTLYDERCELKLFLKHLISHHGVPEDSMIMLLEPAKTPPAALQTFLSPDEAARLLEAAAGYGRYPKRMLAMVAILIQYGVRSKDVIDLTLDDIDWARGTITFPYSKTGRSRTFEITSSMRYMLLDYMKNERPKTDCPNVFPRMRFPVGPLTSTTTISDALRAMAERAGISVEKGFGCHTLRRTSATALMKRKVTYPAISKFLNHEQSGTALAGTTMRYLKVDIDSQRQAALEVPNAI